MTLILVITLAGLSPTGEVDYSRDVKPLFARHCVACHGEARPRGGLRLDTAAMAFKGGKTGPAIVVGHADESALIEAVSADAGTERMPLKRTPLSDAEIATLRAWIDHGAKFPANEIPTRINETHWAFMPPKRPAVPTVSDTEWSGHPIDAFIRERQEKERLTPSPEADRRTLIRRVTLDLIGLPPTPLEVSTFVNDKAPDAYERLVDRLLASPHHGERRRGRGSTLLAMPTPTDTASMPLGQSGSIATGSSTPSTATCRSTSFPSISSPATYVPGPRSTSRSRPASIATPRSTRKEGSTPSNSGSSRRRPREHHRPASSSASPLAAPSATTTNTTRSPSANITSSSPSSTTPTSPRSNSRGRRRHVNATESTPRSFACSKRSRRIIRKSRSKRAWEANLDPAFKVDQPPGAKNTFDAPARKAEPSAESADSSCSSPTPRRRHGEAGRRSPAMRRECRRSRRRWSSRERTKPPAHVFMLGGDFTRQGDPVAPGVPAVLPTLFCAEREPDPARPGPLARRSPAPARRRG